MQRLFDHIKEISMQVKAPIYGNTAMAKSEKQCQASPDWPKSRYWGHCSGYSALCSHRLVNQKIRITAPSKRHGLGLVPRAALHGGQNNLLGNEQAGGLLIYVPLFNVHGAAVRLYMRASLKKR